MSLIGKLRYLLSLAEGALARALLRQSGVTIGGECTFYGAPIVSRYKSSTIEIGSRVVLCSESRYTALGVNHPVVLRTLGQGAKLKIGNDVGISGGTICAASEVSIGDFTMMGANVTIADTDFHPLLPENRRYSGEGILSAPVIIGRNVFIGAGSFILKGVRIGENSVIGASSVVTRDIPANVIAAGNPCKVLRGLPEGVVSAGVNG